MRQGKDSTRQYGGPKGFGSKALCYCHGISKVFSKGFRRNHSVGSRPHNSVCSLGVSLSTNQRLCWASPWQTKAKSQDSNGLPKYSPCKQSPPSQQSSKPRRFETSLVLNNEKGVKYVDKHFLTQATSLFFLFGVWSAPPRGVLVANNRLSLSAAGCF